MSMEGYLTEESNGSDKRKLRLSPMPESYEPSHDPTTFHPPFPPSPPQSPEEDLHHINRKSRRKKKSSSIPSGYGRLSWQLSSSVEKEEPSLPPLYRRFEDVNHRVLLYLQDEIAQMEEELHVLDEYEEMHRVATAEQEGTNIVPASRRMDAQAQVYSSLHYRREEVMAALVQKTQQYTFSMIAEFSGRLLVVAMVGGAASAIASNSAAGAERFVASHDGWRIATFLPILN
ncbi:hypothetical protein APSETT445_002037 [Aspergillus pseudonomiae]